MKKIYFVFFLGMLAIASCKKTEVSPASTAVQSQNVSTVKTVPVTAASFPRSVIDINGGAIIFWAKMPGYHGTISVGGTDPHFFALQDGISDWYMGFNANDGAGNGGLIGSMGAVWRCGTGLFGYWTYEKVFQGKDPGKWHLYKMIWRKDGIGGHPGHKVEIFIDGVLNSTRWQSANTGTIPPLTAGVFNIITRGNPSSTELSEIMMDELVIFNSKNHLVLWNGLGSKYEITHSYIGPNGSFNGGGDAHFVPGVIRNALAAKPVFGVK